MANERLRKKAAEKHVRLWEIADKFGVADASFSRMLRRELSVEKMQQALQFVDDIADSRQQGA